jgi:hypothetical protein
MGRALEAGLGLPTQKPPHPTQAKWEGVLLPLELES